METVWSLTRVKFWATSAFHSSVLSYYSSFYQLLFWVKWVNALRNCRAYNSVELDSDHRILNIRLATSLRTSKGKPCKRPKFNWKKLQDPATKQHFQLELSNRFHALSMDVTKPISDRYVSFETTVQEVAKKEPCGLPSKKQYSISKSRDPNLVNLEKDRGIWTPASMTPIKLMKWLYGWLKASWWVRKLHHYLENHPLFFCAVIKKI